MTRQITKKEIQKVQDKLLQENQKKVKEELDYNFEQLLQHFSYQINSLKEIDLVFKYDRHNTTYAEIDFISDNKPINTFYLRSHFADTVYIFGKFLNCLDKKDFNLISVKCEDLEIKKWFKPTIYKRVETYKVEVK